MSRIGLRPIPVPTGVDVEIGAENAVRVKGPKGELRASFSPELSISREDGVIRVARPSDQRQHRSLHGLTRTLLSNMVTGVTDGYRKDLEILGVGYRAAMDGSVLILSLGYSHPVRMQPPPGITYTLDGLTRVAVAGIDKQVVGEEAARIRGARPPEPYKGKGVRYAGERVRRKAGKAGKAK